MPAAIGPSSAARFGLALFLAMSSARAADAVPAPGDVSAGALLFSGATPMKNGGAACGACHAVGGGGALLAASLGPDLSRSFDGMPAEAVDGILQDLPFPTMTPIYTGRALTAQERADLAAFLVSVNGAPPPTGNAVAGTAAAIAVFLMALFAVRARRRKPPTRATLVAHPPAPARRPSIGRPFAAVEETRRSARSVAGGSR